MSALTGLLKSATSDTVNDNVGEWAAGVIVKQATGMNGGSVLFALTSLLGTEDAESPEYNWFTRQPVRRTVYSSAAEADTAATTLSFDDASGGGVSAFLTKGTIIENRTTGEQVIVTADAVAPATSVARGFGGTAAAAVSDNDLWLIVSYAAEEGTNARRAVFDTPGVTTNYLQEFKATAEVTRDLEGSRLRSTASQRAEARNYALEVITNDIEINLFNGRKTSGTGPDGGILRTTGGIKDAIISSVLSTSHSISGVGGEVEIGDVDAWLEQVMLFGTPNKVAFCGPRAFSALSRYANSGAAGFQIMNLADEFGLRIHRLVTPNGDLDLIRHPLFANIPALTGDMFVVDMKNIKQKIGNQLILEEDIQTPGATVMKDQFIAKLGVKMTFAEPFGYAKNLLSIVPNT